MLPNSLANISVINYTLQLQFLQVHILFKIWIQHEAVRLQEEQKETTKENRRPEYTSVFLFAFTYVGINLDYVDLKRILQEAGNKPPWEESKLKTVFEQVITIPYVKTPKVKLCSGGTPDPSLGYSIQKLAFTNKGEEDFANLN